MEYVAIDFQTANRLRVSACSIALVTVRDGEIIDTFYSLIRPDILHFDEENTARHGITKDMVKDKPYFADLWPAIKEKIKGKTLVAHYARFDMDVLTDLLDSCEEKFPDCNVLCSCVLSQAMFPELAHHRLTDVTEHIGYKLTQRYNAMAHARACVAIVEYALQESHAASMADLADFYGFHMGYIGKGVCTDCEFYNRSAHNYDSDFNLQRQKPVSYSSMDNKEYLKYWGPSVAIMFIFNSINAEWARAIGSIGTCGLIYATYLRFKGTKKPLWYGCASFFFTAGVLGFFDVGRAPKK